MPENKTQRERAFTVPFILFMVLLAGGQMISSLFKIESWVFTDSQYWIKPLQTVLCGALLVYYWRYYDWNEPSSRLPSKILFGQAVGIVAFLLWIAPQIVFNAPPRLEGFDPAFFGEQGWPYWLNLGFRFLRLVVVVPLVEEIFWRGFLMRWLIKENFTAVPFGTFQIKAFGLVALFFMLVHETSDYPAAFLTGLLYNLVAVRTQSLWACVQAHAITNLLLGIYIVRTEQWGFW
jgi:CAAX prenyl protease-like protein